MSTRRGTTPQSAKPPQAAKMPEAVKAPEVASTPGAAKMLANVDDSHVFWSHDGRILHNLRELEEALNTMSEETYTYHANAEKNDFSNWVRDCIQDEKLSSELARAHSASLAAKKVKERVQSLTGKRT